MEEKLSITSQQAKESLSDIKRTSLRSAVFYEYKQASIYLILWGIMWFFGFGLGDLWQKESGWIWLNVGLIGFILTFVASLKNDKKFNIIIFLNWVIIGLGISALFSVIFWILPPITSQQVGAIITLVMAFMYIIIGFYEGFLYTIAGLAIICATLIGFFFVYENFGLWMAPSAGGSLVVIGLWMRR
jgi:hypothetical protein